MKLSTSFTGGNAHFLSQEKHRVVFTPDLRDSDEWFYWAFEVNGAQGEAITFEMQKPYVGYHGAAVSHDLVSWEWSHTALPEGNGFTYTFGEDESRVYFAHHMLYLPHQFETFCNDHYLAYGTCGTDAKGTPIPRVEVGKGERTILLTARHHACESTGNYVMEGIVEAYLRHPLEDCRLVLFPFVDADGVSHGDQGKGRHPHDHNRDYTDAPLYEGVKAVIQEVDASSLLAAFDLHSPWHLGGRNDTVFCVHKNQQCLEEMRRFSSHFERCITPTAMPYKAENDIPPGVEWNQPNPTTCASFCALHQPNIQMAFTLETTYFGTPDFPTTQSKLRETGACFWQGFLEYQKEKNKP